MIRTMLRKVLGCLELDPLLLRPRHIVRPKQPLHLYGKLHSRAGVRREQLFPNCDVHHTSKNPQFLMDGCRLKPISLNDPGCGPDLNSHLKPSSQILLKSSAVMSPTDR